MEEEESSAYTEMLPGEPTGEPAGEPIGEPAGDELVGASDSNFA